MNTIKTTTISSRMPTHIVNGIDDIAKITEHSRSFHIKKALELYQLNFAKHLANKLPTKSTQLALDELKNKTGKSFNNINELFADLDN
ncbi:MAG: hypothetical protein HAW58_04590 [Candidatus Thioglobus sp.]|nr:hypothetical protein [Candidatus Thioglobus sp.]